MDMQEAIAEARKRGEEAARTAASWTVDGNTSAEHARKVLALIVVDGIGGLAEKYLPQYPDLSGEWADHSTSITLYEDIMGVSHADASEDAGLAYETLVGSVVDALAQAFEDGVAETFEDACVAELRKAATC